MGNAVRLPENTYVDGFVRTTGFQLESSGTRGNASIVNHQHTITYGQSGTATAVTIPVHVVRGATATIRSFCAGTVVACTGPATVTVDLKINGDSALSAVITLDNGSVAYTPESGTISTSSLNVDDVLTIVVTASAGGSGVVGTGLFATVVLDEEYA